MNVLYLPLDERPCNYKYPIDIANTNENINIRTIEMEKLGYKKEATNTNLIKKFLIEESKNVDYLICSIDMLCYGGLIPSRLHKENLEELKSNLKVLKEIKKLNPKLKIFPFTSIMRTPAYNSSDEEPDYYEEYGERIFKKAYLEDKKKTIELSKEEEFELSSIIIPDEILMDYENRRKINLEVNKCAIQMLEENIFEELVIFQDDSAPYGYTALNQKEIKNYINKMRVNSLVHIYPGADEVGCSLLLKAYNNHSQKQNKVYVEYSSTKGKEIIPKYEDRPMYETFKAHILVTGNICVENSSEADYIVMVNSPGEIMQESWDQFEKRDRTYDAFRNLKYFVNKIKYYVNSGKKVIIVDVAYSNGGDYELLTYLDDYELLDKVYAYSAWNTHANTLGTSLAMGMINSNLNDKMIKNNILHILEDCFYQSIIRMDVTNSELEKRGLNYFDLKNKQNEIIQIEIKKMFELYEKLKISNEIIIQNIDITHPWNRMFEIAIDYKGRDESIKL